MKSTELKLNAVAQKAQSGVPLKIGILGLGSVGNYLLEYLNNWDFPNPAEKDFARYFEGKAVPQVEEILTQYGDLCLIWFDIGNTLTEDQAFELYSLVRRLQPGCLVNSRIGGGSRQGADKRIVCDYTSSGDNEIPKSLAERKGMLYETCATTNDSWGYKPSDQNWKSPETIRSTREHLKSIGANYLLNVGPDGLGRIPAGLTG